MKASMRHAMAGLAALVGLASTDAAAQERWHWIVAPYLWAVDVNTDLDVSPAVSNTISRRTGFDDIIDKLDGAFQIHAEGQGDRFGVFADFTYLGLADENTRRLFHSDSDLDTRLFEAAAVWSPGEQRFTGADVFAGLRYIDLDIASTITPTGPLALSPIHVDLDKSFSDFMLGARYTWAFGERWGLTLRGDGSWGETEGTWNASLIANYKMKSGLWFFGYRYLDVDAQARGVEADLAVKGPALGYGFRF
ncbi:hypothetical protein [Lysobacter arvi]|uniref:Outer membrane beta-barrel protein n=1 Tax=Lysobacter arvi TaxID=3038776 RepID=A0ABU1CA10_9GAMM|nr:hypothetical protein [Lysobacter arvi]MDR0182029.1 hypothetical protein [Lysobacter arvi]